MKLRVSSLPLIVLAVAGFFFAAAPGLAQVIMQNTAALELVGGPWLNTPDNQSITLASRKGKVTIVQFWTYRCINCIHNLDAYSRLSKQFAGQDVVLIGVHTPETASERDPKGVQQMVKKYRIEYPVLLDEKRANWTKWEQQFWPTIYLIDKAGQTRYRWEGELAYHGDTGEEQLAKLVRRLLAE